MKWPLVIANVLAAIALYFMGDMAVAAHRAHAYSVYKELQTQHLLAERPNYDVEKRLRTIADGGMYSFYIALIGAFICLMNAFAILTLFRNKKNNLSQENAQTAVGFKS